MCGRVYHQRDEIVYIYHGRLIIPLILLLLVLFFKNLDSHIIDCGVIQNNDATVGTRFDMHSGVFAKLIVYAPEIIANCLNGDIEFICDTMGRAIWQTVFESAELVECDCLDRKSVV